MKMKASGKNTDFARYPRAKIRPKLARRTCDEPSRSIRELMAVASRANRAVHKSGVMRESGKKCCVLIRKTTVPNTNSAERVKRTSSAEHAWSGRSAAISKMRNCIDAKQPK